MKCCFCGKDLEEHEANNPAPVRKKPGEVCCKECNDTIVIPARSWETNYIYLATNLKNIVRRMDSKTFTELQASIIAEAESFKSNPPEVDYNSNLIAAAFEELGKMCVFSFMGQ